MKTTFSLLSTKLFLQGTHTHKLGSYCRGVGTEASLRGRGMYSLRCGDSELKASQDNGDFVGSQLALRRKSKPACL